MQERQLTSLLDIYILEIIMEGIQKKSFSAKFTILIVILVILAVATIFSAIYLLVKMNNSKQQINFSIGKDTASLILTIDPAEQLKKGEDTQRRNAVTQVRDAILAYFSLNNQAPWCVGSVECNANPSGTGLNDPQMVSAIAELIKSGELKSDFPTRFSKYFSEIFVTAPQTGSTVIVCFKPASNSFLKDSNTKYIKTGETPCTLPDCYWCAR